MLKLTDEQVHTYLMGFWGLNFVLVWLPPESWRIPYLIFVSIYANFVGHWSGRSAAKSALDPQVSEVLDRVDSET